MSDEVDGDDYEEKLRQLDEEVKQDKPRVSKVKRLMAETFNGRRKWILKDAPSVSEVLNVFPLRQSSSVSQHYCKYT